MKYAEGTTVSAAKSLTEIRALLDKHGATHYAYGDAPVGEVVAFRLNGTQYRLDIARPTREALRAEFIADIEKGGRAVYSASQRANRIDWGDRVTKEHRRRWRARLLWLKAMLEFSDDVPLEQSLLSATVLPDGRTFSQWAEPQMEALYAGGMPKMLGAGE